MKGARKVRRIKRQKEILMKNSTYSCKRYIRREIDRQMNRQINGRPSEHQTKKFIGDKRPYSLHVSSRYLSKYRSICYRQLLNQVLFVGKTTSSDDD